MKRFEYQIKRCKEEDLKDVVKFHKRLDVEDIFHFKPSIKYLLWKYKHPSFNKKTLSLVIIKAKDKIIGICGSLPVKLLTPWGVVNAVWGTDMIIELPYRRYPFLLSQMLYSWQKGLRTPVALAFPRTKEISQFFKKMGFVSLFLYYFVFRIGKNSNLNVDSSSLKFETINCFKKNINTFFKKVSSQYDFIICRNKTYLNWRYFSHSFHKYKVITALKNKKILGYIVIRKEEDPRLGCNKGYILDILGDWNYPRCLYFLAFRAFQYFKGEKVEYVYCLLSHKKYIAFFRKVGFSLQKREECWLDFKSIQLQSEFLRKKNWHITMGDGDFQEMK